MSLYIYDGNAYEPDTDPVPANRALYLADIGVLVAPVTLAVETFVYTQTVAATVWTIQHNMGRFPGVSVVTSAGDVVEGDVHYTDSNQAIVTFSAAFSGNAYLN